MLVVPSSFAQTVLGLTNGNMLLRFSATAPGSVPSSVAISGLQSGDTLVGLDIRPATGVLYSLASSGRLYTIDPASGTATLAATLTTPPSGSRFGVDFNPVADRLRVVSDSGQSLRIDVGSGATTVDGSINPAGPQVVAVAYTNSVAGASSTALYDIDAAGNQLLLQAPPNDGTVAAVGTLGVMLDIGTGFDILTVGGTNTAYAALRVAGTTGLYNINLSNGAATLIGTVGGNPVLVGIALSAAPLPSATAVGGTAIGLNGTNALVRFATTTPSTIVATTPVSGLQSGDSLVGIDFRPANGLLYALASSGRLYTVNPATGAATLATTLAVTPSGVNFGVDFNPVADRLRVVSNTGQNLRVNVDNGDTIVDGTINPGGTQLAAIAYTNSAAGATATGLYYLDAASGALFLQNPPNNGSLVQIGSLGVAFGGPAGFDILASGGNTAYAALSAGGTRGLYTIDLVAGAATLVGPIGGNPALRGLAITTTAIGGQDGAATLPVNSFTALLIFGLGMIVLAVIALRRRVRI
jgi:hypothetical protein